MSMKTRGIVIWLTILIVASPAVAASAAETDTPRKKTDRLALFVRDAVAMNPTVNAARAALDASAAYSAAASRPIYNPELEFEVEDSDTKTSTVGISQTLDWGGKRRARLSVAEAQRLAVKAEFDATRWQVSVEILAALSNYQTESERNVLARGRAAAMQQFAEISQQRFSAGDISQVDLDLALLAFTQARMQQATAAVGVAESKQAVTNLVANIPVSHWPEIGDVLPGLTSTTESAEQVVMGLPHVRAAQMQVVAASEEVKLRERQRRVDPTLTVRGGKEGDDSLVSVSVTVPIRVRNSLRHEVTAASAEHRQAQQVLSDISRRAYTRFIGAKERYQISHRAWQDWSVTGDVSLQSQSDLLRRLWEAGELSTTDYLVQLRQTLDTAESALELRRSMWRAWTEWMTASGRMEQWLGAGSES